ncbi:MAG TPA: hypothetical protein VNZ53_34895, partial [Steroidobacteraceae bacterium]|nr:hypothetical protein [Steroidobacteraceae bacterium]
ATEIEERRRRPRAMSCWSEIEVIDDDLGPLGRRRRPARRLRANGRGGGRVASKTRIFRE